MPPQNSAHSGISLDKDQIEVYCIGKSLGIYEEFRRHYIGGSGFSCCLRDGPQEMERDGKLRVIGIQI